MSSNTFSIPWAAVYSATKEGVRKNLLFGRSDQSHGWKLVSCTVAQTRYWACSTAQFTITRQILDSDETTLAFDKELESIVLPEDPIIIEMGYADSLFTDTVADKSKNRVFFGYVDTINVKASARGVKVVLSCRDPMRFLIDNKFTGQLLTVASGGGYKATTAAGFDKFQPGAVRVEADEINQYLTKPGYSNVTLDDSLRKDLVIAWLLYAGSNGACKPGYIVHNQYSDVTGIPDRTPDKAADNKKIDLPSFNTPDPAIELSSRMLVPPKESGGLSNFNIMNKFPLEVIKHIGSLEAEPREFYADMNTGRLCWRKRRLLNRDNPVDLFFLKPGPKGEPPNVISAEVDWSSVGTVSEIVVVNPNAEAQSSSNAVQSSGILKVIGRLPDDRFLPELVKQAYGFNYFTKRTRYVFDDTISSEFMGNAHDLIDALLRIWGKDLRAGTAVIPGNPFIVPGTAIRAHNFGLFNGFIFRVEAVTHTFTASGSSKGFKSSLAFAEPDEDREVIQDKVKDAIKKANGEGMYVDNVSKKDSEIIFPQNSTIQRETIGEGLG